MKHEQPIPNQIGNITSQQKKDLSKQTRSESGDNNWQFKILVAIIGLGVLMLILKSLGIV
jgi:hypothetical protein